MILLTGATGYLGPAIAKALKGQKVRCLVRDAGKASFLKKYGCSIVEGDVTDKKSLAVALSGVSTVIHAAAAVHTSDHADYMRVNVEGTRNLAAAAKKAKVKHFIFLSSILAAYDNLTPYAKSKLEAEKIVSHSGLPYTLLRISVVYKPDDDKTIGKLVGYVKRFPVIPLIGLGNNSLQPVYIGDVAAAVARIAGKKPRRSHYYLAGPQTTYREVIRTIASRLNLRRFFLPVPPQLLSVLVAVFGAITGNRNLNASQVTALAANKVFDCRPAREDFGFSPLSFREGLRKCIK